MHLRCAVLAAFILGISSNAFAGPTVWCDGPLTKEESTPQKNIAMFGVAKSVSKSNYEQIKSIYSRPGLAVNFPDGLFAGSFEDFEKKRAEYFCRADYANQVVKAAEDAERQKGAPEVPLAHRWVTYRKFAEFYPYRERRAFLLREVLEPDLMRLYGISDDSEEYVKDLTNLMQVYGISDEQMEKLFLTEWNRPENLATKSHGGPKLTIPNSGADEPISAEYKARRRLRLNSHEAIGYSTYFSTYQFTARAIHENYRFDQKGYAAWKASWAAKIPTSSADVRSLLKVFRKAQEDARKTGNYGDPHGDYGVTTGCEWAKEEFHIPNGTPLCMPDGTPIPVPVGVETKK